MSEMSKASENLLPVVLGGDIGVYAIGRSFNEAFDCRVLCVGNSPIEPITRSVFFDVEPIAAGATDEDYLAVLEKVAAEHPGRSLVLMANQDGQSAMIARNAARLQAAGYALPFPSVEAQEMLTDKAKFAEVCESLGVDTPRTVVVDFRDADAGEWEAPSIPFAFPVVAKAANGEPYEKVSFEGKRKIWFIETAEELAGLWTSLRGAGFRDTFLVQELIPGDNTCMRSITMYVDSKGKCTLVGSARVLLEDHAPTMIGNPVAMITEPFEDLWAAAEKILGKAGYSGFANFDVKVDPRDGRAVFFEVNPRIGRNSYYMTAAGANPMAPMVEDLVDGISGDDARRREVREEILYSLVPNRLLLRYVRDAQLKTRVASLIARRRVKNPLVYSKETSVRRRAVVAGLTLNHYRKFKKYYPKPTDESF